MEKTEGTSEGGQRVLSTGRQFLYALGNFGVAFSPTVVSAWLGYFYYGQETEPGKPVIYVNAAVFGTIWFLCNALNGFTDPVVGYLSDRTRSAMGRRRPWILIGAPFFALSFFFLWTPITPAHSFANSALLFASLFFFWFFFTVVVGPYCALLPDITPYDRERVRTSAFMGACEVLGTVMGNLLPPLMMSLLATGIWFLKTGYQVMAFIAATSLTLFFSVAVLAVKERFAHQDGIQVRHSVFMLILAALGIEAVITAVAGAIYFGLDGIMGLLIGLFGTGQEAQSIRNLVRLEEYSGVAALLASLFVQLFFYSGLVVLVAAASILVYRKVPLIKNAIGEFLSVFKNRAFPPYVIGIGFYRMSVATVVFIAPFIATKILGSYPPSGGELSILGAVGALKAGGVPDWELAAGYLMMLVMVGAAVFFPLVSWLSAKTGKRLLYIVGLVWMGLITIAMSSIGLFKFAAPLVQAAALFLFAAFPVAIALVIIRPMLADVIDADEKITGKRREGVYNGMEGLIMKVAAGVGPMLAGFLFSAFGSSTTENLGIRLCGPVAGVCLIVAAISFTRYPIKH